MDACYQTPPATYPGDDPKTGHMPPLFGFAPDGVYPATAVTGSAVRSYRTLSPLPLRAVYFLRHFPWSRLRRTLSGVVFPWSPDFPHRPVKPAGAATRPSDRNPAYAGSAKRSSKCGCFSRVISDSGCARTPVNVTITTSILQLQAALSGCLPDKIPFGKKAGISLL